MEPILADQVLFFSCWQLYLRILGTVYIHNITANTKSLFVDNNKYSPVTKDITTLAATRGSVAWLMNNTGSYYFDNVYLAGNAMLAVNSFSVVISLKPLLHFHSV